MLGQQGAQVFVGHRVGALEPNVMIGIDLRRHPGFEPPKHGQNAQGERGSQDRRKIEANPPQDTDGRNSVATRRGR